MPRKNRITRTMKTTKVSVLCLNVVSAEPENINVTVPRTYPDEKSLMKVVRSMIETDDLKAVKIVDTEIVETLYGLDEELFLKYAEPIERPTKSEA